MKIGVIDIGYNAIRAAVYDSNTAGSREIFNNKFKNDTLALLSGEDLDIKHQTYLYLKHILNIFKNLQVTKYRCVATAVLRNHERAEEFTKFIKENYQIDIEIISGEKEAYLSAIGLISGIADANGIAADLGGGSLELAEVSNKQVAKTKSLELGTKVINTHNFSKVENISKVIAQEFGNNSYDNLYLIGGALRYICRAFIDYSKYPLKNLHYLTIPTLEFLEYLDRLEKSKYSKLKSGKKRISQNAILVARAMVDVFHPKNVVVSTYGLKEGVRYEMLPESEKKKNIVLEKVKTAYSFDTSTMHYEDYCTILRSLIGDKFEPYVDITLYAQIVLSRKSIYDQTIPPIGLADGILSSEIQFKHEDRVKLALVMFYSSNFKIDAELIKISKRIITKNDNLLCQIIGNFLRICLEVDGPEFIKPGFGIKQSNNYLEIVSADLLPRPIFEKVCEKLKSIAFGLRSLS